MSTISNIVAVLECDAAVDRVDVGSTNPSARLLVYSGSVPARPDASLGAAVLLATHVMTNPAFGAAADNSGANAADAIAATIGDDVAIDANGTASFARITDRDNVAHHQYSVSVTGGGGEIQFNSVAFVSGALAQITAFTHRQPES